MNTSLHKEKQNKPLQFGLKTILGITLLISVFFAGRLSNIPEMQKMRAEIEQARAIAELHKMESVVAKNAAVKAAKQIEATFKVQEEIESSGQSSEVGNRDELSEK